MSVGKSSPLLTLRHVGLDLAQGFTRLWLLPRLGVPSSRGLRLPHSNYHIFTPLMHPLRYSSIDSPYASSNDLPSPLGLALRAHVRVVYKPNIRHSGPIKALLTQLMQWSQALLQGLAHRLCNPKAVLLVSPTRHQ